MLEYIWYTYSSESYFAIALHKWCVEGGTYFQGPLTFERVLKYFQDSLASVEKGSYFLGALAFETLWYMRMA